MSTSGSRPAEADSHTEEGFLEVVVDSHSDVYAAAARHCIQGVEVEVAASKDPWFVAADSLVAVVVAVAAHLHIHRHIYIHLC